MLRKTPLYFILDLLHYERSPMLQKTPYIAKYGTFRSDLLFEMMHIKKQRMFRNSQGDTLKWWRYSDTRCIRCGKFYRVRYCHIMFRVLDLVPRVQREEDQSAAGLLLRTHSAGPVSQTCLLRSKRRELLLAVVTLDDSTPQRRISD
jgi:hypothetical protein